MLSHAPFRRSRSKFSTTARLSYSCTSSRRATRSMWRCFSSSLRTPPAARKAVRQSSASFPSACASAFFSCSARSMAVTVSSIRRAFSRWAALAFSSCASADCRYSGMVLSDIFGSSSLQVEKIVTYTGQQHDALQMCQP